MKQNINDIKLTPMLKKFLLDNTAYLQFIYNASNDNKANGLIYDIDEGFTWDMTLEGHNYWMELDSEFNDNIRHIQKDI